MNKYLKVDNSDLNVCRIALGTANAGLSWDGVDAFRVFDAYLENGGNLLDTARIYSDWVALEIGRSERVIGDWIRHRGYHDDVVIMTKCGHPRMNTMNISRMSRTEIESDLELSLKALSVDCIDIYCYHRDDANRPVEELIEIMENFVKAGKIRYYACSNWSTKRIEQADAYCREKGYRGFVMNQALFNYGSSKMKPFPDKTMVTVDESMLKYHKDHTGNILAAYMSLCTGFFHTLDAKGESAVQDSPYYTKENIDLYRRIKTIASAHNTGITQVLLGFVLSREPSMISLISVGNVNRLSAAMDTFNIDFDRNEF